MKMLIIDDDPVFSTMLKDDLLQRFFSLDEAVEIEVVHENFSNISSFDDYTVYFIDIDLQEIDGIELARKIKDYRRSNIVVFVSSRKELIHHSFRAQPYFFIRKAHYQKDLSMFFSLIEDELKEETFLLVNYKNTKSQVLVEHILYIEAMNHKLNIVTNEKTYQDNRSLKEIKQLLPSNSFVQVHRSFIINMVYLLKYQKNNITMTNQDTIQIGRFYKKEFEEKYQEFLIR